jgi:uncharacterized protein (TIGR00730 family)
MEDLTAPGWVKNITVHCGSRNGNSPIFAEIAIRMGHLIGSNGFGLVYGGGKSGLMGHISESARKSGARVRGVTLEKFSTSQGVNTEDLVVPDIKIRMMTMTKLSEVAIALPGGLGTSEEIFEWLSFHDVSNLDGDIHLLKPMILLNLDGYFDGMIMQLERMHKEGLVRDDAFNKLYFVVRSPDEAMDLILGLNSRSALTSKNLNSKHAEATRDFIVQHEN